MGLWSDEASALKNGLRKGRESLKARGGADENAIQAQNTKWTLTVGLVKCQDLPKMDRLGAADPYVTFDIPGHDQQRSKTIKNTLWPEWGGQQFVFALQDDRRQMEVTVWDWNRWSGDNKIGKVRFWLAELSGKKSTASYDISLPPTNSKQKQSSTQSKQENHATITLSLSASNAVASEQACRGIPVGAAAADQHQPGDCELVGQAAAMRPSDAIPQVKMSMSSTDFHFHFSFALLLLLLLLVLVLLILLPGDLVTLSSGKHFV